MPCPHTPFTAAGTPLWGAAIAMGFFGDDRDRAYNDGGNDGFGILDTLVGLIPGASSGDGGAADYNTSRGRAVSRSATGKASAAAGGGGRSKYNRRRDADDIIDRHSDGGARILHDAELVARDVQCARAQFGAVLYGVLRWKQAAFTVWVAVISALLLVVRVSSIAVLCLALTWGSCACVVRCGARTSRRCCPCGGRCGTPRGPPCGSCAWLCGGHCGS